MFHIQCLVMQICIFLVTVNQMTVDDHTIVTYSISPVESM